ncbi:MAG: COQ9 family protein [Pseudomonadota bacterium]
MTPTDANETQTAPAEGVLRRLRARTDQHETARRQVFDVLVKAVPFDGWTTLALREAAEDAGLSSSMIALIFPGGVRDAIDLFAEDADIAMLEAMTSDDFAQMKIREKVAFAIRARLNAIEPHKEAARRAAATLALPPYAATGARLVWRTADHIWAGLGDTSTDYNYYTKRATLSAVWTSAFTCWIGDESDNHTRTDDFIDQRIENVMQIEKAKKQWRDLNIDPGKFVTDQLIPGLARLRYGRGS